jgi:hypothetical protein
MQNGNPTSGSRHLSYFRDTLPVSGAKRITSDECVKEWQIRTFGVIEAQIFSLRWFKQR